MEIDAQKVKRLREKTSAGVMDCKSALKEAGGDEEKAADFLREKGLATAAKKAGREASEGVIDSYIHLGGKVGVLLELNCETDFVAKNEEFKRLARDICLQIAAQQPSYLRKEEVPEGVLEKEKEIIRKQALNEGKPEKVVEKIVEGKMEKYFQENCLLEQPFVKDEEKTVNDIVVEAVAKLGENIVVRRYSCFQLGESLKSTSD